MSSGYVNEVYTSKNGTIISASIPGELASQETSAASVFSTQDSPAAHNMFASVFESKETKTRKIIKNEKNYLKDNGIYDKEAKEEFGKNFWQTMTFQKPKAYAAAHYTANMNQQEKYRDVKNWGLDEDVYKKLEKAGYDDFDKTIGVVNKYAGFDGRYNYSRRGSEAQALMLKLNESGVTFTKGDINNIIRTLSEKEAAVNVGKTAVATVIGAGAAAPFNLNFKSQQNINAGGVVDVAQTTKVFSITPSIVGGTTAALYSIYKQVTRNEESIMPKVDCDTTLKVFEDSIDKSYNKKEAALLKDIARGFVNKDGTLNVTDLKKAMEMAEGNDKFNRDEAQVLRYMIKANVTLPLPPNCDEKECDCPPNDLLEIPDIPIEIDPVVVKIDAGELKPIEKVDNCKKKTTVVQRKETAEAIAAELGVDAAKLRELNKDKLYLFKDCNTKQALKQKHFKVGEEIVLPEDVDCDKLNHRLDKAEALKVYEAKEKEMFLKDKEGYCDCNVIDGKVHKGTVEAWIKEVEPQIGKEKADALRKKLIKDAK